MENTTFAFIKTDKKLIKIFFNDITVIKGLGNYVEVYTTLNKRYIYYKALRDLIESLPNQFLRIHNSYIVNLTNIEFFENHQVTLNDLTITVAKSYRECLVSTLNKMML